MKTAAAVLLGSVLALNAGAQDAPTKLFQEFEKKFPPVGRNAAAEELGRLSLALGLEPGGEAGGDRSAKEDLDAQQQSGVSTWLESQLKTSDDSIGAPPPRLAAFLERRQAAIWRIVTLLEHEVPEWGFNPREQPRQHPELLLVVRLSRVLFAAALVEERAGRHGNAREILEAAWSLHRSVAWQPEIIFQLIAAAIAKLEAGVLRKMSEPALEWSDRLSGQEPLERILEAMQGDVLIGRPASDEERSLEPARKALVHAWTAVTDRLRDLSACEISKLSSEEISRPAAKEFLKWKEETGGNELAAMGEIAIPNLVNALHRVTRLVVDCELSVKVLELRQERSASRTQQWPAKFFDADSRACPGAVYEYKSSGGAMSLKFTGAVVEPAGVSLVLPLSFEARAPRPTPSVTPTRRPTVTPTPRPSLTPVRGGA